ncbi:hypothetical protein D3C86_2073240 [compost metagenome]
MFDKMVPDINTASMTPIPAAVDRISTESMSDMIATTIAVNHTKPNSIKRKNH